MNYLLTLIHLHQIIKKGLIVLRRLFMMHLFHHHSYLLKLIFLIRLLFLQISPHSFLGPIIIFFFHFLVYLQRSVFCAASSAIAYAVHHAICQGCFPMYLQPITPFLMDLDLRIFLPFYLCRQKFFHRKSLLGVSLICFLYFGLEHRLSQTRLTY